MSQQEIIEVLLKNKGKPLSVKEIQTFLDISITAVAHAITSLIEHDEIKYIEIGREQAMKKYGCERRIRIFYV
jgi:chromosome segregation and condensation protein ScpB